MSFVRPGEKQVLVRAKEFLSSEDGNDFISRLDMISQSFAPVFGPGGIFPSQVDNFLAIVKKDRDAIVYCNELGMIMTVRAKKMHVNAGDPVSADDIADVDRLDLEDGNGTPIQIPADCGVALVLSQGWRKGVFYDYTVFHPEATDRKDDLPRLFGHFYARLLFQEMFSLTEDQWQRLMEWGWFPFIWMRNADRRKLITWARQESEPVHLFQELCEAFKSVVAERIEAWHLKGLLREQFDFLDSAKRNYLSGDYIGSIQILYPRIEGVMRRLQLLENPDGQPTQSTMVSNLVESQYAHSVLLPKRFESYLIRSYFKGFDERAGALPLSRHSVAHGTSRSKDYDFVKASIGFMILDQIFYYLSD